MMHACRSRFRCISVAVIGCGDAFIDRYFPKLEPPVNQGVIKLLLAEKARGSLPDLIARKVELARQVG